MDRNDRFMIEENGNVLNLKIGTWQDKKDGELYDMIRSDLWNPLDNKNKEVVEVWVYDCMEFLGYIIMPLSANANEYMQEFIELTYNANWHQRARGVRNLPVILIKE